MSRRLRVALTDGTVPHLMPALGEALFQCAAEVKAWQKTQGLSLAASAGKGVVTDAVPPPSRQDVEAQRARMAHDRQQITKHMHKTKSDQSQSRSHGHLNGQ